MTLQQFQEVEACFDTLIVSTYAPYELDVAAPIAASRIICDEIARRALAPITGRCSHLSFGPNHPGNAPSGDWLEHIANYAYIPVKFGLYLTDRRLTSDVLRHTTPQGVPFILVDWWQWFRRRVPEDRLSEAYVYLCYASEDYWNCRERSLLNIDEARASNMASEGNRLLGAIVSELVTYVSQMWQSD